MPRWRPIATMQRYPSSAHREGTAEKVAKELKELVIGFQDEAMGRLPKPIQGLKV